MKLKDYIWEIYLIARKQNMQRDVARDMFVANLNQKMDRYQGADLDYKVLGGKWESMTQAEQAFEKMEFTRITDTYLSELSKAWRANDKIAFDAVIDKIEEPNSNQ